MTDDSSPGGHRWLAPVAAAAGLVVIFVSVLSIPLSAAENLALSQSETVGWIMALYGVPGLPTLVLVARHHQPLLLTGNVFLLLFVASLGAEVPWSELGAGRWPERLLPPRARRMDGATGHAP